ncbi:MAG: preprotein translocase subunit SecG [Lachnospiraceae bacterium]|nr:preprotein translocase subunit SecG [Lachnospiraceae bacterium]MCD7762689.1 preprotein translocase subunit SecG [Lachnospiraceae bacterium]MCD7765659.1 preprotein translocase subunit SecG [Lachnospiraceae bacterium]MCD7842890.1 preprotein translocase subunit SecG [Lachnospiraceae bacterium]
MFENGGVIVATVIRIILTVLFILVCIVMTVLVLAQQGKEEGLGSIGGMSNSYWSQNKSRSMEGNIVKITKWLAVAFILIAVILNLGF